MVRSRSVREPELETLPVGLGSSPWLNEAGLVLAGYLLLGVIGALAGASLLRAGLASVLGLFGSGLSLAAVLFPRRGQLDLVARLAVAGGLSLAIGGITGFLLAISPLGLTLASFAVVTLAFNVGCYALTVGRRLRLPPEQRPVWAAGWGARALALWGGEPPFSRLLTVGLLILLAGGFGALYQAAVTPHPDPPMTEFYLLGPDGRAEGYPTTAEAGQRLPISFGIANREERPAEYEIGAFVDGALVGIAQPMQIGTGATQTGQVDLVLTAQEAGSKRVEFILYKDGKPYRALHLWLEVQNPPPTDAASE